MHDHATSFWPEVDPASLRSMVTIDHSITNNRIRLHVLNGHLAGQRRPRSLAGRWLTWKELQELPFASAHRRVLNHLLKHTPLR